MNKNIWNIINSIGILVAIAMIIWSSSQTKKEGFIINQEVFNDFKGTVEAESKLEHLRKLHKADLDSLASKIETSDKVLLGKQLQVYGEIKDKYYQEEQSLLKEYTNQVWAQINQYVKEYGQQNEFSFIYGATGSGALMYASETENLTEEIIVFINNKYEGG